MDVNTAHNVFLTAFVLLTIAEVIYITVLRKQFQQLQYKSELQPLKRMLITAIIFLVLASLPLILVYADYLWLDLDSPTLVYFAVITNSVSKLIGGGLLYLIYNFQVRPPNTSMK